MDAAVKKTPTILGTPYAGGFYAGRYMQDGLQYALIMAPKALGELQAAWNDTYNTVEGALSFVDGLANTEALAAAGSELAKQIRALRIGGRDDWHLGARDQVEMLYRHFKPTDEQNYVYRSGDNPSSVPPGYPYTPELPAMNDIGEEAFEDACYWTSTQSASTSYYAWLQRFDDGNQSYDRKDCECRARAVRRELVIE